MINNDVIFLIKNNDVIFTYRFVHIVLFNQLYDFLQVCFVHRFVHIFFLKLDSSTSCMIFSLFDAIILNFLNSSLRSLYFIAFSGHESIVSAKDSISAVIFFISHLSISRAGITSSNIHFTHLSDILKNQKYMPYKFKKAIKSVRIQRTSVFHPFIPLYILEKITVFSKTRYFKIPGFSKKHVIFKNHGFFKITRFSQNHGFFKLTRFSHR